MVDISWINVYRTGDYIVPHAHTRCIASLVYSLDDGDDDPGDQNSGRFCFVDPRIQECCLIQDHCMTNPLMPTMPPGTMLLFPSHLTHCVNPYGGMRPRISVAWNMHTHAVPGSPLEPFQAAD